MGVTLRSSFVVLILLLFAHSAQASNIVEIAVAPRDIPFLLDDEGQVWAFRKPQFLEEPIKLPNLNHIKKIAPYIAVDTSGRVFTWSLNTVKTDWDQESISEAVYNVPQKVDGLQGVTSIASSGYDYFVAVVGNKEIRDWSTIQDKPGAGTVTNGPIRTVISRAGVKAVAATSRPKVVSIKGAILKPVTETMVALFDDGTVMGWGITPSEPATEEATRNGMLLTKLPGAAGIAMNDVHTVILSADGVPIFWGGCGPYVAKDSNGHPWSPSGVNGQVVEIKEMAINQGNDNVLPDAFIKRDGSVWAAYAPSPVDKDCIRSGGDKRRAWQLTAGAAAAIQVAAADSIFMLDAERKLWTTAGSWMNTKFHSVMINLK